MWVLKAGGQPELSALQRVCIAEITTVYSSMTIKSLIFLEKKCTFEKTNKNINESKAEKDNMSINLKH